MRDSARKRKFPTTFRWLEPELFQPFLLSILICLALSEFVRGALTLSLLPTYGRTVLLFAVERTALALSIQYAVDTLLRSPAGWLTDRFGERPVLVVGFAVVLLSIYLMMHVHTVRWLLLAAALYGMGVTPVWPAAMSAISIAAPESKRASFMGYLYIFWLIGAGLGPVLINFVIGRTYQAAFWLLLVVEGIAFVLAFVFCGRPRIRAADTAPGAVGAVEPVTSGGNVSGTSGQITGRRTAAYWRSLWHNVREVAFLFPGMFAQTFAVASLIPILTLYAKLVLHISGAAYSTVLIAGGGLTILLLIPAGKWVDRYGPRRFLVGGFVVAGVTLGLYPLHHTLATTYATVCALGLCYAFILPAWNFVLDHSIDKDKKATLWGVFMTVEGAGSAAGPYIGGLLWDRVGTSAPFWVSGGVIVCMGVLYLALPIEAAHGRASRSGTRGRTDAGSPAGERMEAGHAGDRARERTEVGHAANVNADGTERGGRGLGRKAKLR